MLRKVSHTLYGCVDWNFLPLSVKAGYGVTPCMGVWIETNLFIIYNDVLASHPVWVCGLKPCSFLFRSFLIESHPVWVCGLKHDVTQYSRTVQSHTLYGCVDWNKIPLTPTRVFVCHTLYGCVDWNDTFGRRNVERWGHTLYGCVDWNIQTKACRLLLYSHTLYGCVDWNRLLAYQKICNDRHTLYGCVDWNLPEVKFTCSSWVTPCMGVWIETKKNVYRFEVKWSHPVWVCGLKHSIRGLR